MWEFGDNFLALGPPAAAVSSHTNSAVCLTAAAANSSQQSSVSCVSSVVAARKSAAPNATAAGDSGESASPATCLCARPACCHPLLHGSMSVITLLSPVADPNQKLSYSL